MTHAATRHVTHTEHKLRFVVTKTLMAAPTPSTPLKGVMASDAMGACDGITDSSARKSAPANSTPPTHSTDNADGADPLACGSPTAVRPPGSPTAVKPGHDTVLDPSLMRPRSRACEPYAIH